MTINSEAIYEIKVNKKMEFITGNTAFYRFLGKRLYYTFDKIMLEEEVSINSKRLFGVDVDTCFTMRLYDEDGTLKDMVVRIKSIDSEDVRTILCADIDNLYAFYEKLKSSVQAYSVLLSQFDCVYFIYDKATEVIETFKLEPEYKLISKASINEFEEKISKLNEEKRAICEKSLTAIKNGMRGFDLPICEEFACGIIAKDNLRVSGVAVYEDGKHIKTLGNISTIDNDIFYKVVNKDQLTGLMLKEDVTNYASNRITTENKPTTIAIIDIDNFKLVNDNYGHMKGDETLRKCASIIEREIAGYGRAGRIGGDEFLIIIEHDSIESSTDDELIRTVLRSIKNDIFTMYTDENDGFHISASIGAATYPADAGNYENLFMVADFLLYRAKNKGKNRYIKYDPAKHDAVEVIVSEKKGLNSKGIIGRKGISKSEVVCKILDNVANDPQYGVENIFKNIIENFGVERMIIYSANEKNVVYQCGSSPITNEMAVEAFGVMEDETLMKFCKDGIIVINNIKRLQDGEHLYNTLKKLGIISFMQHRIKANDGNEYIISYEALSGINVWNTEDFYLYRIFDRIFEKCFSKECFEKMDK